jgi:hypothetical protein
MEKKKIGLDLAELKVESFETSAEGQGRGTVKGYSTAPCNPTIYPCDPTNYEDSCATYTEGGDETCMNCTARAAACTEGEYCYDPVTVAACTPPSCVCFG